MSSINFDNAYLLLIMIPVMVLLAIPFFLAVKKDNANMHNILSAVLHLLMGICIVFALAGTTVETTVTETDVYVLADVSYSADRNLDTIDNYIEELQANLPKNSRLGVVCFAKEQQLLVPLGKSLKSVKSADFDLLDASETDIEGAFDYASTLFRDGVIKRVVVMTDGKQTHVSDSNALKRSVDTLRAEGIMVDAVYIDNNLAQDAQEVQMLSAVATQNTYCGKQESVVVTVRSNVQTRATVSLYRGSLKLEDKSSTLSKGNNEITFNLDTSVKGDYEYEVVVDAEKDENNLNNNIKFSQKVSDAVNVLLIATDQEDIERIKSNYSDKATVSVFGVKDELPLTVEELCCYDEIVISNVNLTQANNYVLFLSNLNTVVSSFGKSLVTYGNVFTHDSDELDTLANMLPVKFGNDDGTPKLYTIVIDASSSMAFGGHGSRIAIAKSASKQLVSNLKEGDWACIVTFNGNYYTVCSPTPIFDDEINSSRQEICDKIDAIETQHGTIISFGLQEAYNKISSLSFSEKQIMLISDGRTFENVGSGAISEDQKVTNILEDFSRDHIPVSVIDVGRDNETTLDSQRAKARLEKIANLTSGTYFYANSLEMLENVVFGEGFLDDITDVVFDEPAFVSVSRSSDAVLKGVEFVSTDYVTGFIYSKAKAGATTALELLHEEKHIPLYSYWNYGNGKVSSFVSTVSQTSEWENLRLREPFLANVLSTNIPSKKANYPFVLETVEDNGYITITVTPAKVSADTKAKITLTMPGQNGSDEKVVIQSDLKFATYCYKYSFATEGVGKYEAEIEYQSLGLQTYTANYSYYVPYLVDYDSFAVYDIAVLHKMIGSEGTVMDGDDVIRIVNDEDMVASYVVNMTLVLLSIAVAMFVIDIIVRKLKWEDIKSLFGKGKK